MEELIKEYGGTILAAIGGIAVIAIGVYVLIQGRDAGSVFGIFHTILGRCL